MRKKRKGLFSKILVVVCVTMGIISFTSGNAFAQPDAMCSDQNTALQTFLNEAFEYTKENGTTIQVVSEDGTDAAELYQLSVGDLLSAKRFDSLNKLLVENNLRLSYTTVSIVCRDSIRGIVTESVSNQVYQTAYDSQGHYGGWITKLSGTISYNTATNKVTGASTPSLSIVSSDFNSCWLANVSTGRSIYTYSVYFWGNYTMYAQISGVNCNFGSHSNSFTATP